MVCSLTGLASTTFSRLFKLKLEVSRIMGSSCWIMDRLLYSDDVTQPSLMPPSTKLIQLLVCVDNPLLTTADVACGIVKGSRCP